MHVACVVGELVLRCHILDRWAGMMWNIMIDLPLYGGTIAITLIEGTSDTSLGQRRLS
jgi:hypothetical protein